jgi:hypothetical protein
MMEPDLTPVADMLFRADPDFGECQTMSAEVTAWL